MVILYWTWNQTFSQIQQNGRNIWTNDAILMAFEYYIKNQFYCWRNPLYPIGLGGNIKKWYDHSRVLVLFGQKTQTGDNGFKLNNMVVDNYFVDHISQTFFLLPQYYTVWSHLIIFSDFFCQTIISLKFFLNQSECLAPEKQ